MASDPRTVSFIVDQLAAAGHVAAKPMFGEYGIYCDGRMIAMVCDDRLFVKPTPGGRAFAGIIDEAPPYPGAKPCLLVDGDRWDDAPWLADLARITTAELPLPKPRKRKIKGRPAHAAPSGPPIERDPDLASRIDSSDLTQRR